MGGDQSFRRQLGPCHGQCTTWARCCATDRRSKAPLICPDPRAASCDCSPWGDGARRRTDTTKIKTTAVKTGDRYVVRPEGLDFPLQHSELMILLPHHALAR